MSEPRSRTVRSGGIDLNVASWGDPAAPPIMLVHGMWDHNRSWDRIAQQLSPDYHVIAPDLRGHGDSGWAGPDGYTLGAFVRDLADVTVAFDLRDFALLGHSLGGVLGLRLAAAFPDRVAALVGIECVTLPIQRDEMANPTPYPVRLRQWIERRQVRYGRPPRLFDTPADAAARLQERNPTIGPDTIEHLVRHGLRPIEAGGWTWKWDPDVRGRPPEDQRAADLRDVLAGVRCPSLLVYGDNNLRPPPTDDLLGLMQSVELEILPGGSHSLHHQMHDRFFELLNSFLERHYGRVSHA